MGPRLIHGYQRPPASLATTFAIHKSNSGCSWDDGRQRALEAVGGDARAKLKGGRATGRATLAQPEAERQAEESWQKDAGETLRWRLTALSSPLSSWVAPSHGTRTIVVSQVTRSSPTQTHPIYFFLVPYNHKSKIASAFCQDLGVELEPQESIGVLPPYLTDYSTSAMTWLLT